MKLHQRPISRARHVYLLEQCGSYFERTVGKPVHDLARWRMASSVPKMMIRSGPGPLSYMRNCKGLAPPVVVHGGSRLIVWSMACSGSRLRVFCCVLPCTNETAAGEDSGIRLPRCCPSERRSRHVPIVDGGPKPGHSHWVETGYSIVVTEPLQFRWGSRALLQHHHSE